MEKEDYSDTTIIIPTFNEEENISELLKLIEKLYKNISIIISDDGSKDKTQKIVKEHSKKNKKIRLLDRSKETVHGLTISVVDASKTVKTKYIVVMDGDLQHPPEKIKEIVRELRKGNDIVAGARKRVFHWQLHRKIISKIAMFLGKIRLSLKGAKCDDILSGFFGIKTKLMRNIIKIHGGFLGCQKSFIQHPNAQKSKISGMLEMFRFKQMLVFAFLCINKNRFEMQGYKILFDILKNIDKNTKIKNIYYDFGMRKGGRSKIGKKHMILFLRSLFS